MLKSLRNQLIFSHVLPLLIMAVLVGVALVYVQTQVLLVDLSEELLDQAQLLAGIAGDSPAVWGDPEEAQAFIEHDAAPLDADIVLYDAAGNVLAVRGTARTVPTLSPLLNGDQPYLVLSQGKIRAETVDVIVPVAAADGQVLGALRLTQQFTQVARQFQRLYVVVGGVLGAALIISGLIGSALAVNLQRPIAELTRAIHAVTAENHPSPLPERGPNELHTLAVAFNRLLARLRLLEVSRRRLLANLVHELGRPLGALLAATEALAGGAADSPRLRSDLLLGMQDEIARLRRLLDDLAGMYDRTLGALELNQRPVDLATWLPAVLAPWRETARANGIAWHADLPADLPRIIADPDRLAQVFGNLSSNAIKYTPLGGAVSVEVTIEPHTLLFRFRDTGPGIPPEEREHIFEPFHRAQVGRRFPQGMGLGLAIAREIVAAHNGTIRVESAGKTGSVFTVSLPLQLA
jgi:signal transduction histidine kinase